MPLRALIEQVRDAVRDTRDRAALEEACGLLRTPEEHLTYTDEAIAAFEAIHARQRHDPAVLHHLAIAHHARAWDLELRGDPEALEAWVRALGCWNLLSRIDGFWDLLRARLVAAHPNSDPDLVTKVREELQQELTEVHH
jgi:hypothetical protein